MSTNYKSKTTLSNYQKPTKIDYSSGDPFYNIKQEQRQYYEETFGLQKQMNDVIQNLSKFPILKKKVEEKLDDFQANSRNQAGNDGAYGS